MKKRLSKALTSITSRRTAEQWIREGRVQVGGVVAHLPQMLVDEEEETILVDGAPLKKREPFLYFVLNKPAGYICSQTARGKKVLDLFAHFKERLFTVGRLDKETTGLLLITNDGAFANSVIHPSFGITKEYLAKTDCEILPEHLEAISRGTKVEGVMVKPLRVRKVRKGTLKIVVGEGRKREVRALLADAGLEVRSLARIRIGSLQLGTLPVGHFRPLSKAERESLSPCR